jgi:hypothetical protein
VLALLLEQTMKIKLYPEGFDPLVAWGVCDADHQRLGVVWTPEDTNDMLKLVELAV